MLREISSAAQRLNVSAYVGAAGAIALLVVSVQLFVVNARGNQLAEQVATLSSRIEGLLAEGVPAPGDALTPTGIVAIDGAESQLPLGRRLLVFVVSPTCRPCIDSLPDLNRLYTIAQQQQGVMGVSSADFRTLGRFRDAHRVSVPLYSVPSTWLDKHHLISTPTVMIVSSAGLVESVWVGAGTIARESPVILRQFDRNKTD